MHSLVWLHWLDIKHWGYISNDSLSFTSKTYGYHFLDSVVQVLGVMCMYSVFGKCIVLLSLVGSVFSIKLSYEICTDYLFLSNYSVYSSSLYIMFCTNVYMCCKTKLKTNQVWKNKFWHIITVTDRLSVYMYMYVNIVSINHIRNL